MRVVLQRVQEATVIVDHQIVAEIGKGYVLLVGIERQDTKADAEYLSKKIVKGRLFLDENMKMNQSILDVGGSILSISQFTLFADTKKGNRPSFIRASHPEHAKTLYDYFNTCLKQEAIRVKTGIFGADMKVSLINDGPVTIIYDTKEN